MNPGEWGYGDDVLVGALSCRRRRGAPDRTKFESDLKVAFVKCYWKIQNKLFARVTTVQYLFTPSHLPSPAFDAVSGRPG